MTHQQIRELVKESLREVLRETQQRPTPEAQNPQEGGTKKLLSRQEAADLLGVSVQTIASMLRDGMLEHVRIRRRVLIPLTSILQYASPSSPSDCKGGKA